MKARLVEPQDCPHQVKFMPPMTPSATSSGSASGKAISAFLPPSSSITALSVSAAAFITARPVGTEPISAIIATSRWRGERGADLLAAGHDVEHAGRQDAVDQFGKPQRRQRRLLRRLHHHGVAGRERRAALPAQNMNGWLNGMMRPTTPRGSRTEKLTTPGPIGIDEPFISVTRPA